MNLLAGIQKTASSGGASSFSGLAGAWLHGGGSFGRALTGATVSLLNMPANP